MTIKLNRDLQVKLQRFNRDKRARFSLIALMVVFFLTLPAEFLCNVRPIFLVVDGKPYVPIVWTYNEQDFGGPLLSEPDYKSERFLRILKGESPDASMDMSLSDFDEEDDADLNLGMGDFDEEEVTTAPLILTLDDFEEDNSLAPLTETEAVAEAPTTPLEARNYWMLWPPGSGLLLPYFYRNPWLHFSVMISVKITAVPDYSVARENFGSIFFNRVTQCEWIILAAQGSLKILIHPAQNGAVRPNILAP